jgi:AraC-like DNA-binding protein
MPQSEEPNLERRHILRRVTASLVDIVVAQKDPGYTSNRSMCPDGQFWLPVSGIQLVNGHKKQRPFELMYYAPKEPAVRVTDTTTIAYGVRIMLSELTQHERADSWFQGREMTWETKRMVIALLLYSLKGRADQHTMDEAVAQWIAKPGTSPKEQPKAKWLKLAKDLIHEDSSLSLIDIGRQIGIAPAYLSAQFSQTQGQTLSQYRRQTMVQKALKEAHKSTLNESAIEAGFYDASHFHRACLAELNAKPSELKSLIWPT